MPFHAADKPLKQLYYTRIGSKKVKKTHLILVRDVNKFKNS